uniref:Pep_M12B_propep domain-containing protein n=1 Tax=Syphacia muris TaxID=451379 RepID=A0A0N5AKI1_9BILA
MELLIICSTVAILGVNIDEGKVYFLNRHEARRRRSASRLYQRSNGASGLAIDCDSSCYFRLRQHLNKSNNSELRIHLHRWNQLPYSHNHFTDGYFLDYLKLKLSSKRINSDIITVIRKHKKHLRSEIRPLVQYVDTTAALNTRISRVAPSCIYSAHVNGLAESSIVNLCDSNGGMVAIKAKICDLWGLQAKGTHFFPCVVLSSFYRLLFQFGTLALPDGTYIIEPIEGHYLNGSRKSASSGTRKAHLVYKARPLSFHSYDYAVPSDQGETVFDDLLVESDQQNTTYQSPLEQSISFIQINELKPVWNISGILSLKPGEKCKKDFFRKTFSVGIK